MKRTGTASTDLCWGLSLLSENADKSLKKKMGCYEDLALGLQTVVTARSPRKPKDAASKRSLKAFVAVVAKLIGLAEWC